MLPPFAPLSIPWLGGDSSGEQSWDALLKSLPSMKMASRPALPTIGMGTPTGMVHGLTPEFVGMLAELRARKVAERVNGFRPASQAK